MSDNRIGGWMRRSAQRKCGAILATACAGAFAFAAHAQDVQVPPLNGFQPLVMFGMTDEQYPSDFSVNSFSAQIGSAPGANGVPSNTLPIGQPQKYFIAVLDTGAQSSIITLDTANQIDLADSGRLGDQQEEILGASGTEITDVTDALGVYMSGLNGAKVTGGNLGLASGATQAGMWNTSVLTTEAGSALPNIMGSPTIGLYQVSIKSSQPQHVTVGGTTYQSPLVGFAPQNTAVSSISFGKVALTTTDTIGGAPAFEPSLENFDNTGDNPTTPTLWESIFANVKVSHTGGSETDSFLLDTGAQVSVLSSATAADVGIFTTGDNPTKPDFFTEVTGVGGSIEQIPGYYINGMTLTTTSGPINFGRVPVIVLDLPDPRNPNQELPGVLGTNLFTDRDLIINIGTGNSNLYVSAEWMWKTNGSGSWSNSANWNLVLPNGIDTQANFFSAITSAATITVDGSGFTVGSLAFNNTNRYTLNGPGTITLSVSAGQAQINVVNGSHTINAPVTLLNDTAISIDSATSTLTISSDVSAAGMLIDKEGPGTLQMKNVRAGSLTVNGGTVYVTPNGTTSGASEITALTIGGGTILTGKLDLANNALAINYSGTSPASDIRNWLQAGFAAGSWNGNGIVSSNAAANLTAHKTAIGFAEGSIVGNPTTFFGQTVDSTSLLMRYTEWGDANLDGTVNAVDFNMLAANFNKTGEFWWQGDFNYDGVVNAEDFAALASDYGQVLPAPALGTLVPEPGSAMLLLSVALIASRRRHT